MVITHRALGTALEGESECVSVTTRDSELSCDHNRHGAYLKGVGNRA